MGKRQIQHDVPDVVVRQQNGGSIEKTCGFDVRDS